MAIARSGTARRLRRVYAGQLPAVSYVARIAPVLVTWLSTSRSGLAAPSSGRKRLPPPRTSGMIISRKSSTSPCWTRVCVSRLLPTTWRSPSHNGGEAGAGKPVRDRAMRVGTRVGNHLLDPDAGHVALEPGPRQPLAKGLQTCRRPSCLGAIRPDATPSLRSILTMPLLGVASRHVGNEPSAVA